MQFTAGLQLSIITVCVLVAAHSHGQCDFDWQPGDPVPGVNGQVNALAEWDQDGTGPAPPMLVIGGQFWSAGNQANVGGLVGWDGTQWHSIGGGVSGGNYGGRVSALIVRSNGRLAVGGTFTNAGTILATNIAEWDGSQWHAMTTGVTGDQGNNPASVFAFANMVGGDLAVGGFFSVAGGVNASALARWDGATWQALGGGMTGGTSPTVHALATRLNGDLIAGGEFTTAGGVAANGLARWSGSNWISMGTTGTVKAVATMPSGDVLAAIGGTVRRWNGTTWTQLGSAFGFTVEDLPGDQAVAVGGFSSSGGVPMQGVALWDGAQWQAMGAGVQPFPSCVRRLSSGSLYVGGNLSVSGSIAAKGLMHWNGTAWEVLGPGVNGPAFAASSLPDGAVLIAGYFSQAGAISANHIAARSSSGEWTSLSTGFDSTARALLRTSSGDIVAGGSFTTAGGASASRIARWDGAAWHALGSGVSTPGGNSVVSALAVLPNGDLIAGGVFTVAGTENTANIGRWNGTAWSPIGGGTNGMVNAIVGLSNNDIVIGGSFTTAGGVNCRGVGRWDHATSTWTQVGPGITSTVANVRAIAVRLNGRIVAGGSFTEAGGVPAACVASWHDGAWHAMGTGSSLGPVYSLAALADGGVVAGGAFSFPGGGQTAVARWQDDVGTWTPVGGPVWIEIDGITELTDGRIAAVGMIRRAGDYAPSSLAVFGSSVGCFDCDPIDFNGDGLFPDTDDIAHFIAVFGGAPCPTGTCGDTDFNNDGLFPDTLDIDSLLSVFSGGPCL